MPSIQFFNDGIVFSIKNQRKKANWIKLVAAKHKFDVKELVYVFSTDSNLLGLNKEYLSHHTFTDIITFDLSTEKKRIEGEIYISIERVKENADAFGVSFQDELDRVMIHGVLHLMGYKDKSASQKSLMRKKEDACLSLR